MIEIAYILILIFHIIQIASYCNADIVCKTSVQFYFFVVN